MIKRHIYFLFNIIEIKFEIIFIIFFFCPDVYYMNYYYASPLLFTAQCKENCTAFEMLINYIIIYSERRANFKIVIILTKQKYNNNN